MPYLKPRRRAAIDEGATPVCPGELNYAITRLCIQYVEGAGLNYTHCNDVVGALESAKLEFVRRMVSPYEDTKIAQNGDVYPT